MKQSAATRAARCSPRFEHLAFVLRACFGFRASIFGFFATLIFVTSSPLIAHEGPPFPILMDKRVDDYVVSVWADPDIGEAQFFIIVESPEGGMPLEAPEVSMWVEPISGRLDRAVCETERQTLRNQMQFEAQPYFDQRDMWIVGFRITPPGGESHELTAQVESTPPGYGWWDLAIYMFPFALLGGLWVIAMVRRRRLAKRHAHRESVNTTRIS